MVGTAESYMWEIVCEGCSIEFLIANEKDIDWKGASCNKNLTLDLMKKHQKEISFYEVFNWCEDQEVKDEFPEQYRNYIFMYGTDYDKDMENYLNNHIEDGWNKTEEWSKLCESCSLKFLYEFEDDIDWEGASCNKNLNIDLIKKHKDEIHFFSLFQWAGKNIIEAFPNEFEFYLELRK